MSQFEPILGIDVHDVIRRRSLGQSWDAIAATYGDIVSPRTLQRRVAEHEAKMKQREAAEPKQIPVAQQPQQIPVAQEPQQIPVPSKDQIPESFRQSLTPSVFAEAHDKPMTPEPPRISHEPVKPVVRLLVRGEHQLSCLKGFAPVVAGVQCSRWTPGMRKQFGEDAEQHIYIVISKDRENSPVQNAEFLLSIALDPEMRKRAFVSTLGVSFLAKAIFTVNRNYGAFGGLKIGEDFERMFGFVPIPIGSQAINQLVAYYPPEVSMPQTDLHLAWQGGGSAGSNPRPSGATVAIPESSADDLELHEKMRAGGTLGA